MLKSTEHLEEPIRIVDLIFTLSNLQQQLFFFFLATLSVCDPRRRSPRVHNKNSRINTRSAKDLKGLALSCEKSETLGPILGRGALRDEDVYSLRVCWRRARVRACAGVAGGVSEFYPAVRENVSDFDSFVPRRRVLSLRLSMYV